METVAAGRIAFWEGGSLWVFDVPRSAGAPTRNAMHAHHAFQLTFSLGGVFTLHLEDRVVAGPNAVVAPDTPHAFEAEGLVALLFIEPESRAGRSLLLQMQGEPAATISAEQARDSPDLIKRAFVDSADPRSALREVGVKIVDRIGGHTRPAEPDRRVRQIIKWANDNLEGPVGINEAADAVGLSPSRASHLFVEETGLPFRTYVLWLRVSRAVDAHAQGMNLTDAAHQAGFADSAHLSRTFKRMFGLCTPAVMSTSINGMLGRELNCMTTGAGCPHHDPESRDRSCRSLSRVLPGDADIAGARTRDAGPSERPAEHIGHGVLRIQSRATSPRRATADRDKNRPHGRR